MIINGLAIVTILAALLFIVAYWLLARSRSEIQCCGPAEEEKLQGDHRKTPSEQGNAEIAVKRHTGTFPPHGNETVLLVEDHAQVRESIVAALKAYGYRVIEASAADEALAVCEQERGHIHLLLTDAVMPQTSGKELVAHLGRIRPGMKALIMSSHAGDGQLTNDKHIIQKPFTPEALAHKVRAVLGPPPHAACVLVVDDEAKIRSFLRLVLEPAGYDVIEAPDGKQAFQKALVSKADLVIMDLVMPEQEGIETILALRRELPSIGIIAISGAFDGQFLTVARAVGADATLDKPVGAETLLTTVVEVLSQRRKRRSTKSDITNSGWA